MRLKITILLISVLLIAGCGQQSVVEENRYTGTQGVVFSFIPDIPPDDEVYEDSNFRVGIELQNRGANDADGFLSVGYEKTMMNVIGIETTDIDTGQVTTGGESINFILSGRGGKGIGYKGQITRNMVSVIADKIALSEKQNTQLSFNLCYDTKTSYKENVCIDPDIYNEFPREKACTIQDISTSSGQGGPISITRVETKIIPEGDRIRPRFKIHIANNGDGLIIDAAKTEKACTGGSIGKDSYSIIRITPTLDGKALVCNRVNDQNKFDLSRTTGSAIECETPELYDKATGAHLESLEIELEYGYMQTYTKTITIYKKEKIA